MHRDTTKLAIRPQALAIHSVPTLLSNLFTFLCDFLDEKSAPFGVSIADAEFDHAIFGYTQRVHGDEYLNPNFTYDSISTYLLQLNFIQIRSRKNNTQQIKT